MKRSLSILLSLSIIVSCFTNCIKANENTMKKNNEERIVEEYKQKYEETNSYYVYKPNDIISFLQLDMNKVIDEFLGIKICKRILNENFELDINKITYNDLTESDPNFNIEYVENLDESKFGPKALVLPEVDGGWDGTNPVPVGYNSIIVSSKYTSTSNSSNYYYQQVHYLSHDAISTWYTNYNTENSLQIICTALLTTILGLNPASWSVYLGLTCTGLLTIEAVINNNFWNNVRALSQSTSKKAMITIKRNSQSVTEWTNNYWTCYNRTINGWKIESDVDFSNI